MEIKNKVLISVDESDIVDGQFINKTVTEVADDCFYGMESLKHVSLPKVTKIGNGNFRYNAALTSVSVPLLAQCGDYNFRYNAALTSVSVPLLAQCGDYNFSDNAALTSVSVPLLAQCGNGNFSYNAALTSVLVNNKEYNVKGVDGFCYVVIGERTSKGIRIYTGYNWLGIYKGKVKAQDSFVAEKDGFFAHGETVKKAIGDLQFKIVTERLKKEPINPDTLLTVNHYRAITGACDQGVRSWLQSNNIPYKVENDRTVEVEPITAKDLLPLLEKTGAYGYERFKALLTF